MTKLSQLPTNPVGANGGSPLQTFATPKRQLNLMKYTPDRLIRDRHALEKIRQYVINNPFAWQTDQLHPNNPSKW